MRESNFEVGEQVFIDSGRYGEIKITPTKVKRVTKTLAVVEVNGCEQKFSQHDGQEVPRGEWYSSWLKRDGEYVRNALHQQAGRKLTLTLRDAIQKVQLLEPTIGQINKVHRAYAAWATHNEEEVNA